jgi:hypothetical protein
MTYVNPVSLDYANFLPTIEEAPTATRAGVEGVR